MHAKVKLSVDPAIPVTDEVRAWLDEVERLMQAEVDRRLHNFVCYGTTHPELDPAFARPPEYPGKR